MIPLLNDKDRKVEVYKTIISCFLGLYCFKNGIKLKSSSIAEYSRFIYNTSYFNRASLRFLAFKKDVREPLPVAYIYNKKLILYGNKEISEENFLKLMLKEFGMAIYNLICSLPDGTFPNSTYYFGNDYQSDLKSFEKTNFKMFRFVCGTGISLPYLGEKYSWENIKNQFREKTEYILGRDTSNYIKSKIFNTNYGEFQLLKDIDINAYNNFLLGLVRCENPDFLERSTLTSVGKILIKQNEKICIDQTIVTFNYDDLLERFFFSNHFDKFKWYNKKPNFEIYNTNMVFIKHIHGFLPNENLYKEKENADIFLENIVLTDEEYKAAYSSSSNFAYSSLYDQLNDTCYFIGNSICDYEEQKVIKKHFNDYPSSFHFCFCADRGTEKFKLYKTLFYLRMGVILLWYNSHDEYRKELDEYASKL